ncbi:MAG: DUF1330 domain-containing protein [Pseudomonadota bacterium]
MSALWIANVHVTDEETYAKYAAIATEVITGHGGVFLARGGRHLQMEGRDRARNVVARFPSVEAAEAAYNSPRYQEALIYAHAAAERDLVIVEEVAPA